MESVADPSAVVVWNFSWPHQQVMLKSLDAYTKVLKLLVLGSGCPDSVQSDMLLAGARGYVDHSEGWQALLRSLQQVVAGERCFRQDILFRGIDRLQRGDASAVHRRSAVLTPREKHIVNMVVHGACNKDIAQQLDVSESTVKSHLQHIFTKTGVSSRLALALYTLRNEESTEADRPSLDATGTHG